MKGANTPFIIYHPFADSQLDFVDVLLTNLELEAEIEDSNKGAEMFVVALLGKATPKDNRGDEQRPHRPYLLRSWTYKIFISLAAATVIALHYTYPRTVGTYSPTTNTQTPATSATSSPVLLPAIPDLCTSSA